MSNHPTNIIKEVPKAMAKQIFDIFSGEVLSHDLIPIYSETLGQVVVMTTLGLTKNH